MNEKLDEFHRLVAAGRYREARGILEAEPDIPPKVAEKWLLWLDELHQDEWVLAGVVSDEKKRDPEQALDHLGRMIGGTAALIPVGILLWLIVGRVLTYATASVPLGGLFLLAALICGYVGWQWAATLIAPRHSFVVGAGIALFLLIYLMTSGFPMWYFFEPPLTHRLAAFGLVAPAAAFASYRAGGWFGVRVVGLFRHETI